MVAVGEGRLLGNQFLPWGGALTPGMIVRFSRYGGTDVPTENETLLLFHWKQIFLVKRTNATL